MWADASGAGEVQAVADWGDNLMSHTFNTHTPLRIEVALYGPTEMSGFDMPYVIGSGMDEMQGTDGTVIETLPTVYSTSPRLVIEKLDNESYDPETGAGTVAFTAFDGAVWEAYGQDGPGYYRAEVNVGGKVIFGYLLRIQDITPPEGSHKYGWWRINFILDDASPFGRNVAITGLIGSSETEEPLYMPRYEAYRTWIDVWVDKGGGGSGGGH